jgi:hypothetical protein
MVRRFIGLFISPVYLTDWMRNVFTNSVQISKKLRPENQRGRKAFYRFRPRTFYESVTCACVQAGGSFQSVQCVARQIFIIKAGQAVRIANQLQQASSPAAQTSPLALLTNPTLRAKSNRRHYETHTFLQSLR